MDPATRTILVSGATGQQGSAVARHLLDKGFQVRVLTRDPEQEIARALAARGAEIVAGNFDDRESLDRALDGAYGAYSVQNFGKSGVEGEIRQGKAFAEAARDAGIEHFVYSSVGGAERGTGIAHFDSKWEIEEHIRKLGLPATILRPVFFMDNWMNFKDAIVGGKLPQPLDPGTPLQQIAVDDIGAFAALAFANPDQWIGRATEIAGDDLTMTEIAETFGRVLGCKVEYVQVPWGAFEEQAGGEMVSMYRWFQSDGYEAEIKALRKEYPQLTRLEPFLRARDWASK
ncbi:MAG: NmrA/HSCARG family protein [Gammaproteobacteria bacterium]